MVSVLSGCTACEWRLVGESGTGPSALGVLLDLLVVKAEHRPDSGDGGRLGHFDGWKGGGSGDGRRAR